MYDDEKIDDEIQEIVDETNEFFEAEEETVYDNGTEVEAPTPDEKLEEVLEPEPPKEPEEKAWQRKERLRGK